jgi:hypothetical protein
MSGRVSGFSRRDDDLLDLAAVDVELSGYRSLAAASFVPCAYHLL